MKMLLVRSLVRAVRHPAILGSVIGFFLVLSSCSEDNPAEPTTSGPTATSEQAAIMQYITSIQDSANRLYARLESALGPAAATDSVVTFFLSDTGVQFAVGGDQGIAVEYKSGIRGGLFIHPLDDTGAPEPPGLLRKPHAEGPGSGRTDAIPGPRKTLFVNPHYSSRRSYSDMLISRQNEYFPRAGYDAPTLLLDEQATVEKFRSLDDYGIVFIYSHGWAWPGPDYIQEIYLMTGEPPQLASTVAYWTELKEKKIVVASIEGGPDRYFVSPSFIASHNDFRGDSTFIYGGFCFSFLGSWPETMLQAGAGVYTGFNWVVESSWCTYWARSLFGKMTDTSLTQPMDMQEWINESSPPKSYWDEKFGTEVHLLFQGNPHTTLWAWLQITNVTPGSGLEGADVSISGTGFGTTQGSSTVTFNGISAEVLSWSDLAIRTKVPTGATTGDIVVTVNGRRSNGHPFVVGASMLTDLVSLRSVCVKMHCVVLMSDGSSEWTLFEGMNKPVGADTTFPIAWSGPSFAANWAYTNSTPTPVSDSTRFSGAISGTLSADGMRIVTVTMYEETHSFSRGSLTSSSSEEVVLSDVPFFMRTEGSYYLYHLMGADSVQRHVSSWGTEGHYLEWDPITEETVWRTTKGVSIEWGSQAGTPEISVEFSR